MATPPSKRIDALDLANYNPSATPEEKRKSSSSPRKVHEISKTTPTSSPRASSAGFTIHSSPSPSVSGLGSSVTTRIDETAQPRLRANLTERRPQIRASLRERATAAPSNNRISFYNQLSHGRRVVDLTVAEQNDIRARTQELRRMIHPEADAIQFKLTNMEVLYRIHGVVYREPLHDLIERIPGFEEKFLELEDIATEKWGAPVRNQLIQRGRKSASYNPPPMRQDNAVLQNLPSSHGESKTLALELYSKQVADPTKQASAGKRIDAIEKVISSQSTLIEQRLQEKSEKLKNPSTPDAEKPAIQKSIQELNELQRSLQTNRIGLYVAAAFTPHPVNPNPELALAEAKQAAANAQFVLQSYVDEQRNEANKQDWKDKWLPEFIHTKKIPVSENKAFSVDAAALIFSSLPPPQAFRGAADLWSDHGVLAKSECMEDEILRFALGGDEHLPTLEHRIDQISDPALKQELKTKLDETKRECLTTLGTQPRVIRRPPSPVTPTLSSPSS